MSVRARGTVTDLDILLVTPDIALEKLASY